MGKSKMRRLTGAFGLASLVLWLGIAPLYAFGGKPSISVYDSAANAHEVYTIHNIMLTRIMLGMCLYVTLMVFAAGLRDLIRRADPQYEWLGSLALAAMAVWVGVTLVANGLEGAAALDTLRGTPDPSVVRALTLGYILTYNGSIAFVMTGFFLAVAGYATCATRVLPRWTGWVAYIGVGLCALCVPAMYGGPVNYTGFYNAGGWGPAIIANVPPFLWFLAASIALLRGQQTAEGAPGLASARTLTDPAPQPTDP